jgi:hypothetical protein
MQRTKMSVVAAAAVLGIGLTAAACSSSSSSGPVTGTETFSGTQVMTTAQAASNNFEPTIPLTASGVFSDHGSIHLGGGNEAGPAVIVLGKGDVKITHAATNPNLQPKPIGAASACVYGVTEAVAYTVTGGTGSYAGITGGHGAATIVEKVTLPKLAGGKCNLSNSAVPTDAQVTFSAVGPVTRSSS